MYATFNEINDVLLNNYVHIKDLPETFDNTIIYAKNEADKKFALKTEIPTFLTNHVTTSQLTTTLNDYVFQLESYEKYLHKDYIINELNYTRTNFEIFGNIKTTLWFNELFINNLIK